MTELDHDVAAVTDLLDRYDTEHNRRPVTYVDVYHACQDHHGRAQAVLSEMEGAGLVDWHSNGWVMRRRRLTP